MESLNIGCSPHEEKCAEVGSEGYTIKAKKECRVLGRQLVRMYGEVPIGAQLSVKSHIHEVGTYYELVCYYNKDNSIAESFAFACEELPDNWDKEARKELNI